MPYIHVRYNGSDVEGVLGFKWMSSFLFALALPCVLVSSGLIIRFLATQNNNAFSYYFKVLSSLIITSGGFFFAWTFYSMTDDFSATTYYPILLFFAFGLAFIAKYIEKAFLSSEDKLKRIITVLLKSLYEDLEAKNLINPWKDKDFKKYRIDVTNKITEIEHE